MMSGFHLQTRVVYFKYLLAIASLHKITVLFNRYRNCFAFNHSCANVIELSSLVLIELRFQDYVDVKNKKF